MKTPDRVAVNPSRRTAGLTRRSVLAGAAGWSVAAATLSSRALWAGELPGGNWGSIVELGKGVWAVASTPLEHRDFKTVCNGGIIAGSERVLVVEAFAGRPGAQWVAEAAAELTGRRPTDVVVSHYHGDHCGGLTGFRDENAPPTLHGTRTTFDRLVQPPADDENQENRERREMIESAHLLSEDEPYELDLGGRTAILRPYGGHTASDVVVDLPEAKLLFGGDLIWNQMIPNYVDAAPLRLSETLEAIRSLGDRTVVPGHGPLGEARMVELNVELNAFLGEVARSSQETGTSAADAAAASPLPAPFADWVPFSPSYVERAIGAWQRDLAAAG